MIRERLNRHASWPFIFIVDFISIIFILHCNCTRISYKIPFINPPKIMSLEQCLDFIDTDELLEVTPESLRIRKKILDPTLRKRASFKNK